MNFLLLTFIAFSTFIACDKESEEAPENFNKYGETISLKVGESAIIEDDNLSINFQDLVDDSRCAKGAQCVWQGQAVVNLTVNKTATIKLIMLDGKEELAKDTLDNIIYTLLSVSPYPEINQPISTEEYVIEVRVDKL